MGWTFTSTSVGRHVEPQKADRLPTCQQQAAVRFAEGVLQRAIANRPAVEEQVLHAIVGAAVHRVGDDNRESVTPSLALWISIKSLGQLVAEKSRDALPRVVDRRQVVDQPAVVREREVNLRMSKRQPR